MNKYDYKYIHGFAILQGNSTLHALQREYAGDTLHTQCGLYVKIKYPFYDIDGDTIFAPGDILRGSFHLCKRCFK